MDSTTKRVKPHSFSLAFYNANGLGSGSEKDQRSIIHAFLVSHQVDILLVQETFLKPSKRDPRIANYSVVRNDRTDGRLGGTLIYYRRSLHVIPLDTPTLADLEASVCRIALSGHQPITIASCYLSGNKKVLRSDFEALLSLGSAVILAGDFNSKETLWGCIRTNPNGNALNLLSEDLNFDVIAPSTPTRYPPIPDHSPEVLDIALLKNVTLQLRSLEVLHELDSDHRPVLMRLGPDPTDRHTRTKSVVNWMQLGESLKAIHSPELDRIPEDIVTPDDVSCSILALTDHLNTAIGASSRQVPAEDNRRWALPRDARELLTAKNAAQRDYDFCPSDDRRATLRYHERKVRARMAELRDKNWGDLLSGIRPTHQAYWKLARSLKSDTVVEMPPMTRPPPLLPAFDDDEKAECLAASLEDQCSPSLDMIDPVHLAKVDSEVERRAALPPSDPLEPVKAAEVESAIKALKVKKSPGSDRIPNKVIKRFPTALVYLLVSIFNAALANCIFPDAWKCADVIGIHKPGKKASEPSSYRPISLLSSLGKLYERVLMTRLWSATNSLNLLPHEQFGFRARHSCVQQVHRITEYILDGFNTKPPHFRAHPQGTAAVFLDVAKAFDKVWHNGLIYKLYQFGVPDRLVLILQDFLKGRSFRYRVMGDRSAPHRILAGVPQGSVLSPLLYSLFTSDLPRSPHVEIALFADDTALYTRGWNPALMVPRLQKALRLFGEWFAKWGITVNPEKSAAMYFHPSKPNPRRLSLQLHGRTVPWCDRTKYLGVTLDRKLTFNEHIRIVRNRANFFLGRLTPLICRRSKMSLRNKVTLYKTIIRPVMTYASVAFAHASPLAINSLQIIQSKFIRRATGARWYQRNSDLHCDLELPSIPQYMRNVSRRYFDKAPHHPNPLVVQASNYSAVARGEPEPPLRRRPRDCLNDPDDPIAAVMSTAMGNPTPTSTQNWRSDSGTGPSYQTRPLSYTHRHRPFRRGRRTHRSPRSLRSLDSVSPNNQTVQNEDRALGISPSGLPGQV